VRVEVSCFGIEGLGSMGRGANERRAWSSWGVLPDRSIASSLHSGRSSSVFESLGFRLYRPIIAFASHTRKKAIALGFIGQLLHSHRTRERRPSPAIRSTQSTGLGLCRPIALMMQCGHEPQLHKISLGL
jgi:hypothetical protein